MEIYIEKAFIEKIDQDYQKDKRVRNVSPALQIIVAILNDYGDVNMFIDCDESTLHDLEGNNELIAFKANTKGPIPIDKSINEHFLEYSRCEQTLIFTLENEVWHDELDNKGALCFSYMNYEDKISEIINICNDIKIDLSETFPGWESFKELKKIPKNRILLNDQYLFFNERNNKPMDENFIPFLKNIIAYEDKVLVEIFTNYKNLTSSNNFDINKIKNKVCTVFSANYNLSFQFIQFSEHDRILYSNFFLIECGKGFNFNVKCTNNSKITVETVFDKFNYRRYNNHIRRLEKGKAGAIVN